jgi:hypothetical protein
MKAACTLVIAGLITGCKVYHPKGVFLDTGRTSMDYSVLDLWASHPEKLDEGDFMPEGDTVRSEDMLADVFFIHPTSYSGNKSWQRTWNGPVDNPEINKKTDQGTIRFQASAFNHAGRLFAPRYRQAHFHIYMTSDTFSAAKALDFAYQDVRDAFVHYLNNYNQGRPILIASHSQGTNHAERLLGEFFDGKPLQDKFIAAYMLGMPVRKNSYAVLKPCENADDTGCYISWRTFKRGHTISKKFAQPNVLVTNPLIWKKTAEYAPKTANKGGLLWDFHKLRPQLVDAQVEGELLWVSRPNFFGSFLLPMSNFHVADVNFFYQSIRENSMHRVRNYFESRNQY